MKYVWLKWWENNLLWQDKTSEDAKLIFNNDKKENGTEEINKNDDIVGYLWKKTGNFNEEYKKIDGKVVFDSWSSFWILSIINENFIEETPPNWKFKKNKIDDFDKEFSKDLRHNEQMVEQQKNMNNIGKINEKENDIKKDEIAEEFLEKELSKM